METRAGATTTAPDSTDASVGGTNQKDLVLLPQEGEEETGNNNFTQEGDDDTDAATLTSQEQARWNDMVFPDSTSHGAPGTTSPAAAAAAASHLGYYCKKEDKQDETEEAKVEGEQVIWDGMGHPDARDITSATVSSTTVTDSTSSGIPSSNNQANGQNQSQEEQQTNDSADNVIAEGAATTASPPASMAGAFAICGNEMVRRGGEADTYTHVSEVGEADTFTQESEGGTTVPHSEENYVLSPGQNTENGSSVLIQAHLAQPTEEVLDSQERRIQQLEELVERQQQQLQQPAVPLVHAEIASAPPEVMHDDNNDKIPPPPVNEQEQQTERGAIRSWIMQNRRNRCIALGLVAVVVAVVVVAVAIPLSNSSSGSSDKGVATNNNNNSTSPPSSTSTPFSGEPSVAPTTDTGSPAATRQPTVTTSTLNPTFGTSPGLLPNGPWKPLGQEVGGKGERDYFGASISLSRDARVLAVGAEQWAGGDRPGYVSVFEADDSTGLWMAKGQELVGEAKDDRFGFSVALNGDGTILAVGAYFNDDGASNAGHVRVFEHDTSTNRWVQLGTDIDGEAASDHFGFSVSLSKAGFILAAGAVFGSGNRRGSVRMFQYRNSSWEPLGQKLIGQAGDWFGYYVSLSSSNEIVAVGANKNNLGGSSAGQVSMYQYNSTSSKWDPLGSPINGQVVDGLFGSSVSLDGSGVVVAVGAPGMCCSFKDERVLVYSYDTSKSSWTQRGQTLESEQEGNNFGDSVSLSGNGNVLAVGSRYHEVNGLGYSGQVTIFQYNDNTMEWNIVGEPLNGKTAENLGESVSLSEDGTVVAVGADGRGFNGIDEAGSVRVYSLN